MFFVSRWKTVWKMCSFCIFLWFQSSLTYHDSYGPHIQFKHRRCINLKLNTYLYIYIYIFFFYSCFVLCIAIFGISLESLIRLDDSRRTYA